jgi:hypothetical protein
MKAPLLLICLVLLAFAISACQTSPAPVAERVSIAQIQRAKLAGVPGPTLNRLIMADDVAGLERAIREAGR